MKKGFCTLLLLFMLLTLSACECRHTWSEATCYAPKTCTICGETEGQPLSHEWKPATCTEPKTCVLCGTADGEAIGHDWVNATCTEPRVCANCGMTDGEPLGHGVQEWSVVIESTCSEKGTESGCCTVCGRQVERELALKEHTAGDWIVVAPATAETDGVRIKECAVCGKELEKETFSLTPEEIRQQYISQCQSIPYNDLSRYPQEYKGTPIKMSGKVVQICSEASSALYYSTYRVATSGSYNDVVYIYINNYGSGTRILEDDRITFYGDYDGLYSYKTVLGASVTIPSVKVKYFD